MMHSRNLVTIWTMWFLGSFFYAYQYILRVLPSIMMPEILTKFKIDAALYGQFTGFYYLGYAGMHIPIGLLLDKYGAKYILPACIILASLGLVPLIFCDHWVFAATGRLLIGMGSSAAILGLFKIIRLSFTEEKFTVLLGCSVTIGLLGAIYGGAPINYFMRLLGWEQIIQLLIIVGILLAVTTFCVIPKQAKTNLNESWIMTIKQVLTHRSIIIICVLAGLMVGPLEGFADVWGIEYLKTAYYLDGKQATALSSLIFLGMCFGCPLLSWYATKSGNHFECLVVSGFVMGIAFILLLSGQMPTTWLPCLFFLIGLFCAYQILAIYQASTYVPENLVGITTACANMIIMVFGYFFHSTIGKMMQIWQPPNLGLNGHYDAITYSKALMIIPIGLLLGGFGFAIMIYKMRKKLVY